MPAPVLHRSNHRALDRPDRAHTTAPTPTDVAPLVRSSLANAAIPVLCAIGAAAITLTSTDLEGDRLGDDGAGTVPLLALVGMALAALRWPPGLGDTTSRPVSLRSGLMLALLGAGATASIAHDVLTPTEIVGPVLTIAVIATYLLVWGYRSPALLRTLTFLSVLTWPAVASFAHEAIRSSLEQPSRLAYQRLSEIPVFGVADEPWRLFSAQLHRGALVVLATVVLSIGANRWRMSGRTLVDLSATVAGAVLAHHALILSMPIDTYEPNDTTQLATEPALEIAVAGVAVAIVSLVRWRRGDTGRSLVGPSQEVRDRDPFIFGSDTTTTLAAALCLVACIAPVGLVLVAAA